MTLKEAKHIYCIGIGGIGLSAIARYALSKGKVVTGSDANDSTLIHALQKEGIPISIGSSSQNIPKDCDLIIYTVAISDSNAELVEAKRRGIFCMTYPEALGELTKSYTTIAVCGTHGKTTTTAMLRSAMLGAGIQPTVILGSLLSDTGSNFVAGDSEYLIVEACEYKRSFMNLSPSHVIVTNIDNDHLDYYKDIQEIQNAFQDFVNKVENGYVVTHEDVELKHKHLLTTKDSVIAKEGLSVFGKHNRGNARLVLTLCKALAIDEHGVRKGLYEFKGTWRRSEFKKELSNGVLLYDDYGHHPTEIKATLEAFRERFPMGEYNLIVIFQPHLYSRTKLLLDDFATSFTLADTICILPIYAAREKDDGSVSSYDLVEKIDRAIFMESFMEVTKYLNKVTKKGDIILTLGAGDVFTLEKLLQ
jgi:UDP-N-acetylmuramate--alanine ligase